MTIVSAYDRAMTTLLQRIEMIVREQYEGNANALDRAAGLHRNHINVIRGRLKENADHRIADKTLQKIASAARVNHVWLSTGAGPRFVDDTGEPPSHDEPLAIVPSKLRQLPGYDDCETIARTLVTLPDAVWSIVRDLSPFLHPSQPLTPLALADYAQLVAKHYASPSPKR